MKTFEEATYEERLYLKGLIRTAVEDWKRATKVSDFELIPRLQDFVDLYAADRKTRYPDSHVPDPMEIDISGDVPIDPSP